jgi:alginate O-acetyltransferase complex protein AlgI
MLTMLLGGLWHGAGWNFVIWGALHGGALVVHREWERFGLRLPRFVGYALTFLWVCIAWIFFRSKTLDGALGTLRSFALFESPGAKDFGWVPLGTFAALALAHAIGSTHAVGRTLERLPNWAYALFLGLAVPLALAFTNSAVKPFIYFQF